MLVGVDFCIFSGGIQQRTSSLCQSKENKGHLCFLPE